MNGQREEQYDTHAIVMPRREDVVATLMREETSVKAAVLEGERVSGLEPYNHELNATRRTTTVASQPPHWHQSMLFSLPSNQLPDVHFSGRISR